MNPTLFIFFMGGKATSFFPGTLGKGGKITPQKGHPDAERVRATLRGKVLSAGKLYRKNGTPFAPWISVETRPLESLVY